MINIRHISYVAMYICIFATSICITTTGYASPPNNEPVYDYYFNTLKGETTTQPNGESTPKPKVQCIDETPHLSKPYTTNIGKIIGFNILSSLGVMVGGLGLAGLTAGNYYIIVGKHLTKDHYYSCQTKAWVKMKNTGKTVFTDICWLQQNKVRSPLHLPSESNTCLAGIDRLGIYMPLAIQRGKGKIPTPNK